MPVASSAWKAWLWLLGSLWIAGNALWAFPLSLQGSLGFEHLLEPPTGEKLLQGVQSLLGLGLLNASVWGWGALGEAVLGYPKDSRALFRLGFGFLLLSLGTLGLAALHALHREVILALLLFPVLLGLGRKLYFQPRESWENPFARIGKALRRPIFILGLCGAFFLGLSPFLQVFLPAYGWDAFVYHLALPERYLFENGIYLSSFSPQSAFPLTGQMLYLLCLALDSGALAKILHLEFGLLCLVSIACLTHRSAGWSGALAALAIVLADPLFAWELGVAYVDLIGCFYALLTVVALVEWDKERRTQQLLLLGLMAGTCLTVQLRLGGVALACFVLVGVLEWRRRSRKVWRTLLLLESCVVLLALPWMIRNGLWTGNPVSPALQSVFHSTGSEYFSPVALEQNLELAQRRGLGRSLGHFLSSPWDLTIGQRPNGNPSYSWQVGWLYLAGVLALLLSWCWTTRLERLCLSFAGLLWAVWFWGGAQEARYLLPALLVLAIPAGCSLGRLSLQVHWQVKSLIYCFLVVSVLYGQAKNLSTLPWNYGYALGGLPIEKFLEQEPSVAVGEHLRKLVKPREKILLFFEPRAYFYQGLEYLPFHINEGAPTLQWVHQARTPHALWLQIKELAVDWIVWNTVAMQRYPPVFRPNYTREDFEQDLARLRTVIRQKAILKVQKGGIWVYKMKHPERSTQESF